MLRVRVLGELALELDGTSIAPPSSRRARSLLGLLALEHRLHARSALAPRFWPDVLDESARTSLRSALSAVRRSLGPDAERYLLATRERAGLAAEVWTDAAEFDLLVAAGRPVEAVELWRGDLLRGLDDDWVLEARDEWRERVAGALAGLAAQAEAAGDLSRAIAYTRRMVALDPFAEEGRRELIRRLAASGDRAGALTAYTRFRERLLTELRIAPSPATQALVAQLRRAEATPAAPSAPERASGTVTLLFTDLVGSTELLEELGDDDAERLRRIHFGLLRDVALSHAGHEVKNLGDGLMVAFASSLDAAACAVGIQQAVHRHNRREGGERLRLRVGLNAGEPIRAEGDYFGTAVVVAKRLCDRAEGGQILASDLVRTLAGTRGGFTFRPVGALALKGISQPLASYELSWEPAGEKRIALPAELAREEGTLLGRGAELHSLEDTWREAHEGGPLVALVAGEPGIGKTRLVAELCRGAHSKGATILLGRSYEEALVPYQPFVEALGHYVSGCPADQLRLQLGTRRTALAQLVPQLVSTEREAVSSRGDDPQSQRYALFDAVATLLREAASTRPLVLVLDDLHWADPPSLQLLCHIARSASGSPLLVLGTYRDTEVRQGDPLESALAQLRRARVLRSLRLGGLGAADVARLIRARGAEVGDAVARAVAQRTEGNPFYVEEIVRHLGNGAGPALPESVQDLIQRRLRGLDESARGALATAAVIGHEFELETLERVVGSPGDQVFESLDRALRERVLVESASAIGRYTFAHALIRETIYEQLSATRRARLHLRVGQALEEAPARGSGGNAATLAHHYARGGDDARSLQHQRRAAQAAGSVYALEAADGHYSAALETGARLNLSPATDEIMRRLTFERGWVRYMSGDHEAAVGDYRDALESARAAGDRRLEAEALDHLALAEKFINVERAIGLHQQALGIAEELEDMSAQVRILGRLSLEHSNQLDLARALDLGERALELAGQTGTDHDRARAMDALKLAALQTGELDRLEELTLQLVKIERRHGDLWYLQWTLLESSFVPIGRARWAQAAGRLDEALTVGRRIGDALSRPLIHDAMGWAARSRGDYRTALAEGRRAIELSELSGRRGWSAWTRATLGWTLLELRDAREAAAILERGLEDAGWRADRFRNAGQLAWARALLGDVTGSKEAAAQAEEALSQLRPPPGGTFLFGFGAATALARAHLTAGKPERGEALLAPLVAAAERLSWHEASAAALLVTGLCRASREETDAARGPLTRALELARRHALPGVQWEALAALARGAQGAQSERLRAESGALAEHLAAGIGDKRLAGGLLRAAEKSRGRH